MGLILIVDDDPAIREMLDELLADEGHQTLLARDGREAVDLTREHLPDLILMDLMLPYLDGVAATQIVKSDPATGWIRVIAMSAGFNLRQYADTLPADSVIGKPFDLDALLADVAIHLNRVEWERPHHLRRLG